MSLAVGSRLGVFQVTDSLGAGGMGEVYRARDTELGRDVALKVLSSSFSTHPDSLVRFEREARLLASLNHPHIAAIYGVAHHDDGTQALVLELVPGATLAHLIARGPLPLARALTIADQIADALDAAHERLIVHRDLKPANVKVTDEGTVKVLDFGIAKALVAEGDVSTIDVNHTREGTILGTRSYMSPEQSRGLPVDKRTDIWAFGCVLFEMLAGRRPFAGATATDVTLAILERDPDWAALPTATPEPIRRLLHRSLEKDPRRRLRDIADARMEIADTLSAPDGAHAREAVAPSASGRWMVHAAWAAVLVATLAMGMAWRGARLPDKAVATHLSLAIPAVSPQQLQMIAISSDGRGIAVATAAGVVMRDLGDPDGRLLPGTAGASSPTFSPDGTWLAFYADARLKKVLVSGGDAITIADIQWPQRGFAWADNDTIVIGHTNGVLSQMPAGGGEFKALTVLDAAADETSHRWPHVLPGSRVILYAAGPSVSANDWNSAHIVAQSLVTGERRVIVQRGSMPAYADGHVFYVAGQQLLAQRFDPARLEVSGPVLVVRRNVIRVGSGAVWYAVSSTGSLVSLHGPPNDQFSLLWVTRGGATTPLPMPVGQYRNLRLSPDGSRVAATVSNPDSDVWVFDVSRGSQTRITADGRSLWPAWTHDGTGVLYSSTRGGPAMLVAKPANGTVEARPLVSNRDINRANDGTPQGALFYQRVQASGGDIWMRSPDGREQLYAGGLGDQSDARLSPNGAWVAFRSTETGASEVFVQPFPGDASARRQVSVGGGALPAWSHDGRELFFVRGKEVWAAAAPAPGSSGFAEARRLFTASFNMVDGYLDVAPDGRFLMVSTERQGLVPTDFQLTLNIGAELRRRATAP